MHVMLFVISLLSSTINRCSRIHASDQDMLGARPRRACITCSSRRVKCDEVKPRCGVCKRLGVLCHGYEKSQYKWRDQNQIVWEKYKNISTVHGKQKNKNQLTETNDESLHNNIQCQLSSCGIIHAAPTDPLCNLYGIVNLYPLANSQVAASANSLLRSIDVRQLNRNWPVHSPSYIFFIPARLGYNIALDSVVDCLMTLYTNMMRKKTDFDDEVFMRKHGKATGSLRKCLEDPSVALEAETLCATLLMGLVAVLSGNKSFDLLTHVHGASELIRLRGPMRHVEPFERGMLLAAQGPLSTESITKGSIHSLDSKGWRSLIAMVPAHSTLDEDRPCHKLKFVDGFSIPHLIQELLAILEVDRSNNHRIALLLHRAFQFRQNFLAWAREICCNESNSSDITTADETSHHCSTDDFAVVYDVDMVDRAIRYSISRCPPIDIGPYGNIFGWMILINRIIMSLMQFITLQPIAYAAELRSPSFCDFEDENLELAARTFQTHDHLVSSRAVGLLYYQFSIHVAEATIFTTEGWVRIGTSRSERVAMADSDGLMNASTAKQFLRMIQSQEQVRPFDEHYLVRSNNLCRGEHPWISRNRQSPVH